MGHRRARGGDPAGAHLGEGRYDNVIRYELL